MDGETNGQNGTNGAAEQPTPEPAPEPAKAGAIELAAKTLTGDLRDWFMDQARNMPKPWHKMSESEQRNWGYAVEAEISLAVARAVEIIAAGERIAIVASLDSVNFKSKGTEAKMNFLGMSQPTRHALVDAQGGRVLIVIADASVYHGERRKPKIDKDQPDLAAVEARAAGVEDGSNGTEAHMADYPADHPLRKEYDLGWVDGQRMAGEKRAPVDPAQPRRRGRPRTNQEAPAAPGTA